MYQTLVSRLVAESALMPIAMSPSLSMAMLGIHKLSFAL